MGDDRTWTDEQARGRWAAEMAKVASSRFSGATADVESGFGRALLTLESRIKALESERETMRPVVEAALKLDLGIYGDPCDSPEECDEPDFCRLHSPLAKAVATYRAALSAAQMGGTTT